MGIHHRIVCLALTATGAAGFRPAPVRGQAREAAPSAVVVGAVHGEDGATPVAGAVVYVRGRSYTTLTDSLGRYTLPVPEGAWLVSVYHDLGRELGLPEPPTAFVTVERGQALRVDFEFDRVEWGSRRRPFLLEELDVEVEKETTREARVAGVRIDVMDGEKLRRRREVATHVGDLIRGEFLGVRVTEPEMGAVCVAARRGAANSQARLGNCRGQVAVVVDGIIMSDPSRYLYNLPPRDIERIEFLPAVYATTRWGRRAGNGVLFIHTRFR